MNPPGWDARLLAALDPVPEQFEPAPGLRNAAVLLPWFTRESMEYLLMIARPQSMPNHAGQVAFPGGKQESDESPLHCALREAGEELGIDPATVDVFGALPARTSGGGFRVTTIVGRISTTVGLQPDAREVAAIFEVPVLELAQQERWYDHRSEEARSASPHYDLEGSVLWGLTAGLTRDLLTRLNLLLA